MWNAHRKCRRLKAALRSRDLDPDKLNLDDLAEVLERRGMTDDKLNKMVWTLIACLEPPSCTMTHCKSYGHSGATCNCAAGRIPGRCKIFRDYKVRQGLRDKGRPSTPAHIGGSYV